MNTPSNTLDVGDRGWVGAIGGVGVDRWVALVVKVECRAAGLLVADAGTSNWVILFDCHEAKVRGCRRGGFQVGEGQAVALGNAGWLCCGDSIILEWLVGQESIGSVRAEVIVSTKLVSEGDILTWRLEVRFLLALACSRRHA